MQVIEHHGRWGEELVPVRDALLDGQLVVLPTDTVYGLAACADDEAAVRRMYEVKGRSIEQPTAIAFATIDALHERLPQMDVRTRWAVHALLPGPWTLIVDDPDAQWTWLTGGKPGPVGVRVAAGALDLPPFAATSANLAGEPTVHGVRDLDGDLAEHVSHAVDRGPIASSGESTILDITAWARGDGEIRVVRDAAGRYGQALAAIGDGPS